MKPIGLHQAYEIAQDRYAELGVDTESVLARMEDFHLSLSAGPYGALRSDARGNALRKAEQLRQDYLKAMKLVPGEHRLCIQPWWSEQDEASTSAEMVDWMQWARSANVSLDMQVTTHNAAHELTLANRNPTTRQLWIDYLAECRQMADKLGESQKNVCVMNLKLEDRLTEPSRNGLMYCQLLEESLTLLQKSKKKWMRDSLATSAVDKTLTPVISTSRLIAFTYQHPCMITLGVGEDGNPYCTFADYLASLLPSAQGIMLSLCRPSRRVNLQESLMDENLVSLLTEIVNSGIMRRVHYAIDHQHTGLSRSESYVIAARSVQRCQLRALLEPTQKIHYYELNGQQYEKTTLAEEAKSLPWGAVYDEFCLRHDIPCLA